MGQREQLQLRVDRALLFHVLLPRYKALLLRGWPPPSPSSHPVHTHLNTHTRPHTPHSNKRRAFFWEWDTRKTPRSQSKPTPRHPFLPKTSTGKVEVFLPIMYPAFFFSSRKGTDMIKSIILHEAKKASDITCDAFISVPG